MCVREKENSCRSLDSNLTQELFNISARAASLLQPQPAHFDLPAMRLLVEASVERIFAIMRHELGNAGVKRVAHFAAQEK